MPIFDNALISRSGFTLDSRSPIMQPKFKFEWQRAFAGNASSCHCIKRKSKRLLEILKCLLRALPICCDVQRITAYEHVLPFAPEFDFYSFSICHICTAFIVDGDIFKGSAVSLHRQLLKFCTNTFKPPSPMPTITLSRCVLSQK